MVRNPRSAFRSQIELSGVWYYIPPQRKGYIHGVRHGHETIVPVTVLATPEDIPHRIKNFSKLDDVWSASFLSYIVIQTLNGCVNLPKEPCIVNVTDDIPSKIIHREVGRADEILPSGPYFVHQNGFYEAWRQYPDHLDAFEIPLIPHPQGNIDEFSSHSVLGTDGIWKLVAVPSRLYTSSQSSPLAGKRISVKDNFMLKGIKTTMSNRAFTEIYPADTETSEYVQLLVKLGAIIVGKTRMCSFAAGEEPTDQWIDFHCPYNPRGDTYQSPASSSSGAGASLAGYSWLDYSIGTDTAGSIRAPAAANGLYGLRPSYGITTTRNIHPLAPDFDTIGTLARDLASLHTLVKSTSHTQRAKQLSITTRSRRSRRDLPRKILYPTEFFPTGNSGQQALLDEFVTSLEDFLGVKRTVFSIRERWDDNCPEPAMGQSLETFLQESTCKCYYHDAYNAYEYFRQDYETQCHKKPYVGPIVDFRWEIGARVTAEEKAEEESRLGVFRDWFHDNVLEHKPGSPFDTIMVMPAGKAVPEYRDEPNKWPPNILQILGENTIAMVLGIPHLVIPIGQLPYASRISGRTEHRPISASLVGTKGSDMELIKLAGKALRKAGRPTKVQTGRYTFPLAEQS